MGLVHRAESGDPLSGDEAKDLAGALRDANNALGQCADLLAAVTFAVERIDEWSKDHLTDDSVRDWWGHVEPALAHLRRLTATPVDDSPQEPNDDE